MRRPGATGASPIPASVPDEVWKQGVIEYKDLLKLIVCTEEFDARLLEQASLDCRGLPRDQGATRGFGRNGTLNRLMQAGPDARGSVTCDADVDRRLAGDGGLVHDRPAAGDDARADCQGQAAATLTSGVKLEGHPSLKAKARLATAPLSTRDLGNSLSPGCSTTTRASASP